MSTLHWIRWLLVVPSSIAGWYFGLVAGLLVHTAGEYLCPRQFLVSGVCMAPWSAAVEGMAYAIGAGIAGATVVALATWTAPHHRRAVAVVAYCMGIAVGGCMAALTGAWWPFVAALMGGGLALWRVALWVPTSQRGG